MPQHPADGVHRLFAVYDAGVTRRLPVLRQIDDFIRTIRVVSDAGAVHRMLKTVDHMLVDVVLGCVNRAVILERRNLHIVMHGIGVHRLPCIKLARVATERLQPRRVIRRVQLHRRKREGVIRHVIIRRVGRLSFLRQRPDRRRVRPCHLSIRFFLAIQIPNQQPRSLLRVLPNLFHIYVGFIHEIAVVQLAVVLIARRFVDLQIDARVRRDPNKVALLHRRQFALLQGQRLLLRDKIRQVQHCFFRQAFFLLWKRIGRFVVCRAIHHIFLRFGDVVRQTVCKFFCRFIQPAIQCFLARISFFLPHRFFRIHAGRQRRQRHTQRKQPCPNSFCHSPSFQRSTARITSRPSLPA